MRTFTCTACGGTFPKEWTDDDAEAELHVRFPGAQIEDCGAVCDDCYEEILMSIGDEAA